MSAISENHRARKPRRSGVYLPPEVLDSGAFQALNGTEIRVLMDFLSKRRINPKLKKKARDWSLANGVLNGSGEIEYSYLEAADRGYSSGRFLRAVDGLVNRGFLDVDRPENLDGTMGSKYTISDRWRSFGTADFQERPRAKRTGTNIGIPFQVGNTLGAKRGGTDGKS